MKPRFSTNVRRLVEILLREGDLEFGFSGPDRALEGTRAHQKIRQMRPPGYLAEQAVRLEVETEKFFIEVSGRIDGVFRDGNKTVIEEIKSTYRSPDELVKRPDSRHWGQARCYAYLWARKHELDQVAVRLVYWHLPTSTAHGQEETQSLSDLKKFFEDLVSKYCRIIQQQIDWRITRNASIDTLDFPFQTFRRGQRKLAVGVYNTIGSGGSIIVEAPTGIGKTMAVLFASIKAMGQGRLEKIFFLTARTTGKMAAQKALGLLRKNGMVLRYLSLTAKDKICFIPEDGCLADQCPYAAGYYDRLPAALEAALNLREFDRQTVESLAESWRLCPFALSMELAQMVDCVICDYNYVLDPQVSLKWLLEDGLAGHYSLLIDEAHNLVERSREMFSARLSKHGVLELRRLVKNSHRGLYRSLGKINAKLAKIRRNCIKCGGEMVQGQCPEDLVEGLKSFCFQAEKWLVLNIKTDFRSQLLDLYFKCLAFIRISQQYDDDYKTVYSSDGHNLRVKLFCIDAALRLAPLWNMYRAVVFFSATMMPIEYFRRVLGLYETTPAMKIPSPFAPENFNLVIAGHVSTYFHQRRQSLDQVVKLIKALVKADPGNYLVFFPSYQYLEMVWERFSQSPEGLKAIKQEPAMDAGQKAGFLDNFENKACRTLVGFAVLGGVFSEGIDLEGRRLSGAVVVGVGLPAICLERELIRSYHDQRKEPGFDYAYLYPGIIRVFQAAGRVIRSETDLGIVLLVDRRYTNSKYKSILEDRWRPKWISSVAGLVKSLEVWRKGFGEVCQQSAKPGLSSRQ